MSIRKPAPARLAQRLPSHPGETLLELLGELGLRQTDLSEMLGLATSYINDVCRGRRGISTQLAAKLEKLPRFPSAEFWLRLQMNRDLALARLERDR